MNRVMISIGLAAWLAAAAWPQASLKRDFSADAASVDALIKSFYEALSFMEGTSPDLERFRNLFASGAAPCSRTTPGAVLTTDLEGFIANLTGRIRTGTVKSLVESEIGRSTQAFGDIVQVFSAYRKALNGVSPDQAVRGVNALQVVRRDGRWRIASIAWEDESPGRTIPPEYLK